MDWPTVLLGTVVALFCILMKLESGRETRRGSTPVMVNPMFPGIFYPTPPPPYAQPAVQPAVEPSVRPTFQPTPPTPPRVFPTRQPLRVRVGDEVVSTKALVETWKESITGLMKLAQTNLANAGQYVNIGDNRVAVESALTSIENISRALLHCYGEKPDTGSGQGEALRLLARRLKGKERTEFEKTVEDISSLHGIGVVREDSAMSKLGNSFLLTGARARLVLESASGVVGVFSQIINEHFAAEIPELLEVCPKCHSMNVGVMSFSETTVSYTCKRCRHSWVEPR